MMAARPTRPDRNPSGHASFLSPTSLLQIGPGDDAPSLRNFLIASLARVGLAADLKGSATLRSINCSVTESGGYSLD